MPENTQLDGRLDTGSAAGLTRTDLRARGWTPSLIRDLLGEAQGQQPWEESGPRVYSLDRVLQAEQSDTFFASQAQAEQRRQSGQKAAKSRAANQAKQLAYCAQWPLPVIVPQGRLRAAPEEGIWHEHLSEFQVWWGQQHSLLEGLSQAMRLRAQVQARERYRQTLLAAYGR